MLEGVGVAGMVAVGGVLACAVVLGVVATRFVASGGDGDQERELRRKRRHDREARRAQRAQAKALAKARAKGERSADERRGGVSVLAASGKGKADPTEGRRPKGGPAFRPAEVRPQKEAPAPKLTDEERTSAAESSVRAVLDRKAKGPAPEETKEARAAARARIALAEAESKRELERQEAERRERARKVREQQERLEEARRRREEQVRALRARAGAALARAWAALRGVPVALSAACTHLAHVTATATGALSRRLLGWGRNAVLETFSLDLTGRQRAHRLAFVLVLLTCGFAASVTSKAVALTLEVFFGALALLAIVVWVTWDDGKPTKGAK